MADTADAPGRGPRASRPTAAQLLAARDEFLSDVIAKGLRVLFVGVNPGLYSTAVGHNFGRPGNRFWPALALAGLTPRQFAPSEERLLLQLGLGITNIVARTTARADELSRAELLSGARVLEDKVRLFAPRVVAVLGVTAYRVAFARPKAVLGRQSETIGQSALHVVPNPSGLNAHFQLAELARLFGEVAETPGRLCMPARSV